MLDLVAMLGRDYAAMDPADARYAGLAGMLGSLRGGPPGPRFGAATVPA